MQYLTPFTIVGAGDYGAGLLGNLFVTQQFPQARLTSYIDTKPNLPELQGRMIWNTPGVHIVEPGNVNPQIEAGKIPLFQQHTDWQAYIGGKPPKNLVVDLALLAEHAPKALKTYIDAGVKQFVLPKPFTFDVDQAKEAIRLLQKHHIKAAVASNWHYSKITETARSLLERFAPQYPILKVELDYSCNQKDNEPRTPTHDELPHAIQILASTGIIDPSVDKPTVTSAEPLKIDVNYHPQASGADVQVRSYLDESSPTPSGRMRQLKIYLKDDDPEPDIVVNYDVVFKNGEFVSPGSIKVHLPHFKKVFKENNLKGMYEVLIKAFKRPYKQFIQLPDVLTLERYLPIIQQIASIHKQWLKKQVVPKEC